MSYEATVDRYCDSWSDPDPARRAELLAKVWADGASYSDPTAHCTSAAALLDHIASVHVQYPGARIERTSELQLHNDAGRFAWRLVLADGTSLPDGLDLVLFDDDGRIARIVGFFGPLKPREGTAS